MKTTTVIISQAPLGSLRVSEALRMSVGLTLCDDAVSVVFVDDGVYALLDTEPERVGVPEYSRHVNTLKELGHHVYAEQESLKERGLERVSFDPEIIDRTEVARLLISSDCVIRY